MACCSRFVDMGGVENRGCPRHQIHRVGLEEIDRLFVICCVAYAYDLFFLSFFSSPWRFSYVCASHYSLLGTGDGRSGGVPGTDVYLVPALRPVNPEHIVSHQENNNGNRKCEATCLLRSLLFRRARACVRACVRACACVCVCVCVLAYLVTEPYMNLSDQCKRAVCWVARHSGSVSVRSQGRQYVGKVSVREM